MELISVIVPVYNGSETLEDCLRALQQQTDSNYELLVVDDASTDDSPGICRKLGVKLIRLDRNKGQAVARNTGVKNTTGNIIAFTDSDVVVPKNWLEQFRHLLTCYQGADMICSRYSCSLNKTPAAKFAFYENEYRRLIMPLYISSSTSSNCIIRRKPFEKIGGYPEYYICPHKRTSDQKAVATTEDSELGYLLYRNGEKIIWSRENPVGHYFRKSWRGYLQQQIGFTRFAVLSVFKFPGKLFIKGIYSEEKIIPQIFIVTWILAAPFTFWWLTISGAALLTLSGIALFYLFHRKFLRYLSINLPQTPHLGLFSLLLISRYCWLYGIITGIKDGIYMRLNILRTKNSLRGKG